jgi:arginine repressor
VEHAIEQVAAAGAPQFQDIWDDCSAAAKVTLCAFAEMMGLHGIGTAQDVARHLARLRVQVPDEDIARAMQELAGRDILEQLGGGTYRFRNELLRHWLRRNQTLAETLHQVQRYRRLRVRRVSPLRARNIDWGALLLWAVAVCWCWPSLRSGGHASRR